jgi:hypothetical protein
MNTDKAFKQAKWNRIHSDIDSGTTLTDTKKQKFAGQCRSEHGVLYYKLNDSDIIDILITYQSVEVVINDLLNKVGSPVRTPEAVKRQKTSP